ncbi:MAG: ankyrin repeat domain-containing protein [Alphaproteobacteria bacterium]|nr:MAG: ankyrin repeat domain-containing protein [Alphaproteobacteria bacterium]
MFGRSQKERDNALAEAVGNGNTEKMLRLLERGADPDYVTYNYGPLLCRAMALYEDDNALACVKLLLEKGASLTNRDGSGRTPLHYALYRGGKTQVVQTLIDAGADVETTDKGGATPLMTAVNGKHWQGAALVLERACREDKSRSHMLVTAVANGAPLSFLQPLFEKIDIDINAATKDEKTTALHAAVATGDQQVVEWLLTRSGIQVNAQNAKGATPLALAVGAGRTEIVKTLAAAGADPDMKDAEGQAPLVTAARSNSQDVVEELIAAKASLDATDKYGATALSVASQAGSIRMVMTLLAAADAAGIKLKLEPALFGAAEKGHGRVLELLIGAGADVNALDDEGRTPLMKAALSDQVETLSILIKAGAKPDAADRHGMFAYDHAVSASKAKAKDFLARYRHETLKSGDTVTIAAPAADYHYVRLNDHSLEVREGDSLTMTFNFWTQQVIFRDTERPAPVTVQNFADLQRQEAIEEAYQKLKELGGNPPDPHCSSLQKKSPGLK